MNLRQMEVFHAIMRCGSVTAAARQLNVSQPAVSATLHHCEAGLGMKLFQRVGSRLQPTPEAKAIYGEVAAIFRRVDTVGRMTRDMVEGQRGSIAVAGTFPVAHGYLAEATAAFLKLRPNVQVSIQSLTQPELIDRVVNREVELGITYGPTFDTVLATETLFKVAIACAMPTGHPLAEKAEVQAADLLDYPLITFAPQMIMRAIVDQALRGAGVKPEIRVRVALSFTAMVLARAGAGVAIIDPLLLETLPLPGLEVRPLSPRAEVEVVMVHLRDAPLSQTMERFITCLRDVLSRRVEPPGWAAS